MSHRHRSRGVGDEGHILFLPMFLRVSCVWSLTLGLGLGLGLELGLGLGLGLGLVNPTPDENPQPKLPHPLLYPTPTSPGHASMEMNTAMPYETCADFVRVHMCML